MEMTKGEGGLFLALDTFEESRESFARILKAYAETEINHDYFRDLVYGMSGYLQYWRTDIELKDIKEIRERLDYLENNT